VDNSNNLKEPNPEAKKPGPVSNALDAMVGMVLRLADGMGGVGGVYPPYPPSSYADRIRILLDLRGGAQYATDRQFSQAAPVFTVINLLREEDVVAKARFDFSDRLSATLLSCTDPYKSRLPA
jgi:hypothetical protein